MLKSLIADPVNSDSLRADQSTIDGCNDARFDFGIDFVEMYGIRRRVSVLSTAR